MNEVLLGIENRKIEGKGRLTIPKSFEANEGDFVVVILKKDYFEVKEYDKVVRELKLLKDRLENANDIDIISYLGDKLDSITSCITDKVRVDNQGRIYIGNDVRERYNISKDVVVEGIINGFRVWNPEVFYEYQNTNIEGKGK